MPDPSWLSIAPPSWHGWELDAMRALFGWALLTSPCRPQERASASTPRGVGRFVDLSWLGKPGASAVIPWYLQPLIVAYVAGFALPVVTVLLAVVWLLVLTWNSSDGVVNHGEHLLVVVLIAQAVAFGAHALDETSLDLGGLVLASGDATAAWWTVQAILGVYVVTGITKVARTGGAWIARSPGLVLTIEYRAMMVEGDHGTAAGDSTRRRSFAAWALEHPAATRLVFAGGLLVELAAPIGLLGRWWLVGIGAALVLLHRVNKALLRLSFDVNQKILMIYAVNVGYLLGAPFT